MSKLSLEAVASYPTVAVFMKSCSELDQRQGVHTTHLIKSNGVNALCCNDSGDVYLIRLSLVHKISPRNDDHWIARLDNMTGQIVAQSLDTGEEKWMGPVRGAPDPNINLTAIAAELGFNISDLSAEVDKRPINRESKPIMTDAELAEGPVQRTYAELISSDVEDGELLSMDDIEVPDLTDFEIEDDNPIDVKVDREHKGRVSDD